MILESPHERRKDQLIINRQYPPCSLCFLLFMGVTEEIDNSTTTAEIVWRFSRYPEKSGQRINPKQNPHFYLQLPKDAASFDSKFHKDPLNNFAHGLRQGDTIYVLLDKSCRLFLDAQIPRAFGNLWKPHRTVILKGEYSPRRVVCSNPRTFKMSAALCIQKTSSLATLGRAKITGIAHLSPIRLSAASNRATRVVIAKLSTHRSGTGVLS